MTNRIYKTIFVDFDGVISNTNKLKESNMRNALEACGVNRKKTETFVDYFTSFNGVPREKKVAAYFPDKHMQEDILRKYFDFNKSLVESELMPGVKEFCERTKKDKKIILSGGDRSEIKNYLRINDLENDFDDVLCGPNTKEHNLSNYRFNTPAVFIGDALHDYEVSRQFSLDFVFIFAATQHKNWRETRFVDTIVVEHLQSLIEQANEQQKTKNRNQRIWKNWQSHLQKQ